MFFPPLTPPRPSPAPPGGRGEPTANLAACLKQSRSTPLGRWELLMYQLFVFVIAGLTRNPALAATVCRFESGLFLLTTRFNVPWRVYFSCFTRGQIRLPSSGFLGSEPKFAEPAARPEGAAQSAAAWTRGFAKLVSDPNNPAGGSEWGENNKKIQIEPASRAVTRAHKLGRLPAWAR